MPTSLKSRIVQLLRAAALAGMVVALLLLTQHAQAETATETATANDGNAANAANITVWRSVPHPLRVATPPGKLPRYVGWFNLENAEITAGHEGDVLRATLGSFPAGADAVLFHMMTWEPDAATQTASGRPAEPMKQHWRLVDRELRTLPMTALKTLRHIQLVYVGYRRPAEQGPVVYSMQEEGAQPRQPEDVADASQPSAATGLCWGTHPFTLGGAASRVRFALGVPKAASAAAGIFKRTEAYAAVPVRVAMDMFQPLGNRKGAARDAKLVPAWLANAAQVDYQLEGRKGLLLAGNGLGFQPVYTGWLAAGFGQPNARVYGGLVAQTMMVLQPGHGAAPGPGNMNWGTSLGIGAGVHYEWENKATLQDPEE